MRLHQLLLSILFMGIGYSPAQVLQLGTKLDKKLMFNATLNYPFFFSKYKAYELMVGLDYSSKNNQMPSGIAPQVTYGYFLVERPARDYLLFTGLTAGYVLDLNKEFDNQFRVSPHLYAEIKFVAIKVGFDYMLPLKRGYPFISLGFGGGHLLRHFKVM
ncbi:hypothetical protein [Sphingobacterium sp. LRF_L2]|uniref:hypothetical protein n=1 Tax=Sphingobacterium sp. LRF_L2 TaxID=3369421 RepID=UPI003F6046B0